MKNEGHSRVLACDVCCMRGSGVCVCVCNKSVHVCGILVSVRIRASVRRIGRCGETGPSELRMWRDVNDIVREGMVREGSGRQEAVIEVIRMGGNGER